MLRRTASLVTSLSVCAAVYIVMSSMKLHHKVKLPDCNGYASLEDDEKLRLLADGRCKPQNRNCD